MHGVYVPSRVAARVRPEHKRAVWDALASPARLDLAGLAAATGLDSGIVVEIWAEGSAKGWLRLHNDGPGFRWIERVDRPSAGSEQEDVAGGRGGSPVLQRQIPAALEADNGQA